MNNFSFSTFFHLTLSKLRYYQRIKNFLCFDESWFYVFFLSNFPCFVFPEGGDGDRCKKWLHFQRYFQKTRRFIVRIRENMWWTRWNENFVIFWRIWGNIMSIFIRSQNLTKLTRIPTCNFNPERKILRCIPKSVYLYIMNLWKLKIEVLKHKNKKQWHLWNSFQERQFSCNAENIWNWVQSNL